MRTPPTHVEPEDSRGQPCTPSLVPRDARYLRMRGEGMHQSTQFYSDALGVSQGISLGYSPAFAVTCAVSSGSCIAFLGRCGSYPRKPCGR
eukprot:4330664-Pleurochrysis_carterae.AAC.1